MARLSRNEYSKKSNEEDPDRHPEAPKRFNWQALRHFAVSRWIDAGLSPKAVQTFAGHGSLQVMMDATGTFSNRMTTKGDGCDRRKSILIRLLGSWVLAI
jgi:hypothetical protein